MCWVWPWTFLIHRPDVPPTNPAWRSEAFPRQGFIVKVGAVTTEVGIPNLIWTWRGCQARFGPRLKGKDIHFCQSTPVKFDSPTGPLPSPWGEEHWPKCSDAPWSTGECLLPGQITWVKDRCLTRTSKLVNFVCFTLLSIM